MFVKNSKISIGIQKNIKNGSLYILGNIFNKAIAFITVPIFTRLLTTEEYGIVNTYASWVPLLAVFIGLSMGQTIRNIYVDNREELGKYISSMFALAGVNLGIFILLFIFVSNKIQIDKSIIIMCLVESFANFVINCVLMRYVMEEEAAKRTLLMVLPNMLGAIMSVVLILLLRDNKHYGRIMGMCISTSVFGIAIMLFYFIKYKCFLNRKVYAYVLPLSIPLIFHGIACNILGTSDRTLITYYRGASETGIYSLIYNLSMVASVVVSSAESMWIPKMTNTVMKKDYKKTNQDIKVYVYLVTFAFCGLLTIAPELVNVLGGEKYLCGVNMITPIVSASYVMYLYSIYVNLEYFFKKTKMIALSTFVAAGINLLLNFIFIPDGGAVAAAYTTLVSYLISMILHYSYAKKIEQRYAPISSIMLFVIIFVIAGIITSIFTRMPIVRCAIMGILGVIYLISGWNWFKKNYYV